MTERQRTRNDNAHRLHALLVSRVDGRQLSPPDPPWTRAPSTDRHTKERHDDEVVRADTSRRTGAEKALPGATPSDHTICVRRNEKRLPAVWLEREVEEGGEPAYDSICNIGRRCRHRIGRNEIHDTPSEVLFSKSDCIDSMTHGWTISAVSSVRCPSIAIGKHCGCRRKGSVSQTFTRTSPRSSKTTVLLCISFPGGAP